MRIEFLYIVIVALFWGGYPLVARSAGVAGPMGTVILSLSSLAPILTVFAMNGVPARLEASGVYKMMTAGIMMGIGLCAFIAVTNSRNLEASVSIPIMDTSMLVVTVIGAVLFFAEPITLRKAVGLVLLIAGILVLKPH